MHKLIYITASGLEEAEKIGEALVTEKLAACANYFPINSIYYWEGKLQKDQEAVLLVKTQTNQVEKIIKRVKEIHSYQLPAIVSLPIEAGLPEFLNWIEAETND